MAPCPSPAQLEAYAAGAPADEAISDHAERCPACRAIVDEIRENDRFLADAAGPLRAALDGAPADPQPPDPSNVPGFELIEEITRGGQGVVYRALQSETKRPAAVKMLLGGVLATERQRARFDREIELAARLRHPHIVSIFGSGSAADGRRYVAMELVDGVPIDAYVRDHATGIRGSRAWIDSITRLFAAVAGGVAHAHTSGVIHRDLKPSNILVDRSGNPRVLDFGLARELDLTHGAPAEHSVTRDFIGTPAYAAPEQLSGDPGAVTARTDVYALGLCMYVALTGRRPYPGDGAIADIARHVAHTEPTPPRRFLPRIPTDLETIILKALAKDPARRYSSASALHADLEHYLRAEPIDARRDSTWYVLRQLILRHRAAAAASAIVLITVVAAVIGLAILARDLETQRRAAVSALTDSRIQRARLLGAAGEIGQAETMLWDEARRAGLDAADPNLGTGPGALSRRIGWALMEYYARVPRAMRASLDADVVGVRLSPDGSRVIGVASDGTVGEWSIDGTELRMVRGSIPRPHPGARLPDVALDAGVALVGDAISLSTLRTDSGASVAGPVPRATAPRRSLLAPDGSFAVVQDLDLTVRVLDRALTPVRVLADPAALAEALALSNDGSHLAVVGHGPPRAGVGVWSTDDWDRPPKRVETDLAPTGPTATLNALAYLQFPAVSNDGRIVAAGFGGSILLWPAGGAAPPITLLHHAAGIAGLWFDDDATHMVSAATDGQIIDWTVPEGEPAHRWPNGGLVHTVDIRPDLNLLAAGDSDGHVSVYELGDGAPPRTISIDALGLMALAPSADGTMLACGGMNGRIRVIDAHTGRAIRDFPAHAGLVTSLWFDPSSGALLSVGLDGALRSWNLDNQPVATDIASGMPGLWAVRATNDGRYLAVGGVGGTVELWDRAAGTRRDLTTDAITRVPAIAFSPDGSMLGAASVNSTGVVWDTATGAERFRLIGHSRAVRAIAFSADGSTIATGSDDRTIRLWNASTGAPIRVISGLPHDVFDLDFDPSGRVISCVGRGPELLVLDAETGDALASLTCHEKSIFRIAPLPKTHRFVTGGEDPHIEVWDLDHLRAAVRGNAHATPDDR